MNDFERETRRAITDLFAAHKVHLNSQLALEALMESLLDRVDPAALPGIAEEYQAALDRLASKLEPEQQLPEIWNQWTTALEALQLRKPPRASPD